MTLVKLTPGVKYRTKFATSAFAALFSKAQANPVDPALSQRTETFPAAIVGWGKSKLIVMSDSAVNAVISFFISIPYSRVSS
jgi:hypothetical protein